MFTSSVAQRARLLLAATTCGLTLTPLGCLSRLPGSSIGPGGSFPGDDASGSATVSRRPPPGVVSVYRRAPTLTGEATPRPSPSAARSEVFEAHLFEGQCLGLRVPSAEGDRLFGPLGARASPLIGASTSHDSWGPRSLLGPVSPGGPTPQVSGWQGLDTYGLARGGCAYLFLPLLTFGGGDALLITR